MWMHWGGTEQDLLKTETNAVSWMIEYDGWEIF